MMDFEAFPFIALLRIVGQFLALHWAAGVLYNITLHPLAHLPGPRIWGATRLRFVWSLVTGHLVRDVLKLHEEYGDIVRTAPDEVSFARQDAWQSIIANPIDGKALSRNDVFFKSPPGQPDNVVLTNDPHASKRMRKAVMPALSDRSLANQESSFKLYTDLMVRKLAAKVQASGDARQQYTMNAVDWFNWFAFDLVGDLSLGEPFGCLEEGKNHDWVMLIFNSIKFMAIAAATRYCPGLETFLLALVPPQLRKMQTDHYNAAVKKIHRRLAAKEPREDFLSQIIQHNVDNTLMSQDEMESTMSLLLIAGSETTATTLSGIINLLIHNDSKLQDVVQELRSRFNSTDEITMQSLQQCDYLNAVISEGLRLCNPVAGGIMRVAPKGGAIVSDLFVPEGTYVSVNSVAMSLANDNFHRASEFLPERFLPTSMRPAQFENDQRTNQRPFGLGGRSCLGKSFALAAMRLALSHLLWTFDMSRVPGNNVTWGKLRTFVVVEKQPIRVSLQLRTSQ